MSGPNSLVSVRLRAWCATHGEWMSWEWRCFCYADPLPGERWTGKPGGWQPFPQLCRCEERGVWLCFADMPGSDCKALEVRA